MIKVVVLVIALCGLLLILWWRRHIAYNYREAVEQQNTERLESSIEKYKLEFAQKEYQLAACEIFVHCLNKILPDCATYAERAAAQTGCAAACHTRDMLQDALRDLNLTNEKCSFRNIPQTGVSGIDAPILRLYTAAERKKLDVSTDICENVERLFTESTVNNHDIHVLLHYLCDNATISALGLPKAKVRVEIGTVDQKPLIRIYDSGKAFDEAVLAKLGLEQITTRAGAGGSGIGLFTVFEILRKYGASFTLDEAPEKDGFTKLIEIVFDGRHSIRLRTCRESVVAACAARKDMTVERVEHSDTETLHDGTNG
ncbi:MAG: hypothetical protein K2L02_02290 [Clostridia bacterium]|nr:hypothetical protein [Clostridia bacterium]